MLLMGIALAIAEEWVIQQTSIAPLVGLARNAYGRIWGVNWVYFLWAVGYESVWVVLVPVQLTELLFPERRANRWLKKRGFIIAHAVFVLGAFMAWYGWTKRARVMIFHLPPYTPPPLYIVGALLMILLLILVARALPERLHGAVARLGAAPQPREPCGSPSLSWDRCGQHTFFSPSAGCRKLLCLSAWLEGSHGAFRPSSSFTDGARVVIGAMHTVLLLCLVACLPARSADTPPLSWAGHSASTGSENR